MSLHKNLFLEYPNKVFIETGSWRGDGIQYALDAGYEKIISIDIDQSCLDFCKSRFNIWSTENPKINLVRGDSAEILFDIIKDINEPITFWLDSHWQMLENSEPTGEPFPLLKELAQIKKHTLNTHTIIIDDMLIMQRDIVGYTKKDIERMLLYINKNYILTYRANPVINGILAAHI